MGERASTEQVSALLLLFCVGFSAADGVLD